MSLTRLTLDHAKTLHQLYDNDDRTGMYIHYYTLTGNNQALDQATISSFSGYTGAVAECANVIIAKSHPDLYPQGGVIEFSKEIAEDLLKRIEQDIMQGGTGIFTEDQVFQFAKQKWTDKKIGHLFPGNIVHPKGWLTEGASASLQCGITQGAKLAQGNTLGQGVPLTKYYGKKRSQFNDVNKYQWIHIKPHGTDLSLAIERTTGKVVYLEKSRFAAMSPMVQSAQQGAAAGIGILGLGIKSPQQAPPLKKHAARVQGTSSEQKPVAKFLKNYGLKEKDLSPKEQRLIADLTEKYKAQRPQFVNSFPFEFFSDTFNLIGQAAQATNNPKLMHVAQVGSTAVNLFKQISALPGILSSAPTTLAAFHPILGIATALFSLGSLFRRQKQGPNPFAQLSKQLQGISDQVSMLHRDVVRGFNMLAEGQQKIFITMVERFHQMETLIRRENESLSFAIHSDIARLENFIALVHSDLNYQVNEVYLQEFKKLNFLIQRALSPDKTREDRRTILKGLLAENVLLFEKWLINDSGSGMLNGYRYVFILQEGRVKNAGILVNNKLLSDRGVQLECFIGYLAHIAMTHLGSVVFETIDVRTLINPAFWLGGVDTYLTLLENLRALDLEHDPQNATLREVKQKGLDYITFVSILQRNAQTLFDSLLESHRQNFTLILNRVKGLFLEQLTPVNDRDFFKATTYAVPEDVIKKAIDPSLHDSALKFFDDFHVVVNREKQAIKERYFSRFAQLIDCFLDNNSFDEIAKLFNTPICPIGRHRLQTKAGMSCLEVNYGNHFNSFEQDGFNIPFLLSALFEKAPELKSAIPTIYCLAELIGLGHFEITAVADYAQKEGMFIDALHVPLNDYGAYKNYKFTFEIFFVNNRNISTKLCDFDCHSDQLPMSDNVLQAAKLAIALKQRMDKVPPYNQPQWLIHAKKAPEIVGYSIVHPPEFLFLDSLKAKVAVLSQTPNLHKVNRLASTPNPKSDWEKELKGNVEIKLAELKAAYSHFYLSSTQRGLLTTEIDGVHSSRTLILAFMHLCGLGSQNINAVRSLWSNASMLNHAERNGSQSMVPDLVNKDKDAREYLKKLIETDPPSNEPKGHHLSEVALAVELIIDKDKKAQDTLLRDIETTAPAPESKGYLVSEVEMLVGLLEAIQNPSNKDEIEEDEEEIQQSMVSTSPQSSANVIQTLFSTTAGLIKSGMDMIYKPKEDDTSGKRDKPNAAPGEGTDKEGKKRKPNEKDGI